MSPDPIAKARGLHLTSLYRGPGVDALAFRASLNTVRTGDKRFNQPPLSGESRPTRKRYSQVELASRALAPCRSWHAEQSG
ncbi:hypothetical protein KSD_77910 [Ktedonobacter sp. SOSP1-85]|nr:hypothetical protein KSD_77910 [Ktedonobacter sp. SOSP1-85]